MDIGIRDSQGAKRKPGLSKRQRKSGPQLNNSHLPIFLDALLQSGIAPEMENRTIKLEGNRKYLKSSLHYSKTSRTTTAVNDSQLTL